MPAFVTQILSPQQLAAFQQRGFHIESLTITREIVEGEAPGDPKGMAALRAAGDVINKNGDRAAQFGG
jgi:hypothetical protein